MCSCSTCAMLSAHIFTCSFVCCQEVKESSTADYNAQRMTHCAISQTLLIPPIVADHVGNLFNKSSLLEYLLATSRTHTTQTQYSHITSLRDVINVTLTYDESKRDNISQYASYMCPVTSLPANGRYRFVVMSGCGCVLSERAIKQVTSRPDDAVCCATGHVEPRHMLAV